MQVFKLVLPGEPDRIIAFDELPDDLVKPLRRGPIEGFPRYWRKWFETEAKHDFKKDPKPFYILDYKFINKDKETWGKIQEYCRKMTPDGFRLMDQLELMGKHLAPDSTSELTLDPDDIPIVPLHKVEIVDQKPEPRRSKEKVG